MIVDNGGNNYGTESMVAQKGRKLKQYVLEEKLDIIDYAKIIGNRAAGREFNVAESSIREWRKNEQRLRSMFETTPERSRLDGGGRRPVSEDLEKGLLQYVTSRSDNETALTWHDIKDKANALWKDICDRNPEYNDRGFIANMGWVARFVRRNNITLQVTNSASTITPKLVNSSSNSNSLTKRIDGNSICCSTSSDMMVNSSCTLPSSTTSLISDRTVANTNIYCCNDVVKINETTTTTTAITTTITTTTTTTTTATTTTTTTATTITTAVTTRATPIIIPTMATIATNATNNGTVSTKKRRKNFTPKKIVPNDVICLAANNRMSDNNITTTNTTTTSSITRRII
uniref:HTH CENPB-type domain-containing protein n=2 Tax=Loa loa TaxID=7209 RepID=A0A1I7VRT4_LOALO